MDTTLLHAEPEAVAEQVLDAHGDSPEWLDSFIEAIERRRRGELGRVMRRWSLNAAEAAEMFGVSRQAMSKWLSGDTPSARSTEIADLAAATDLLARYIKAERIPGVVRRPADKLDGRSLVELAKQDGPRAVLAACRVMFDFSAI